MFPLSIQKEHLLPKKSSSQLLKDISPKQNYLFFGSRELDFETEISHEQAALMIENDKSHMRVDQLKSFEQILSLL